MPNLVELELNAHSSGVFEPEGLLKIEGLKRLGLIMPDRGVVGLLGRWFEILKEKGGGLERLSIIAQVSSSSFLLLEPVEGLFRLFDTDCICLCSERSVFTTRHG